MGRREGLTGWQKKAKANRPPNRAPTCLREDARAPTPPKTLCHVDQSRPREHNLYQTHKNIDWTFSRCFACHPCAGAMLICGFCIGFWAGVVDIALAFLLGLHCRPMNSRPICVWECGLASVVSVRLAFSVVVPVCQMYPKVRHLSEPRNTIARESCNSVAPKGASGGASAPNCKAGPFSLSSSFAHVQSLPCIPLRAGYTGVGVWL